MADAEPETVPEAEAAEEGDGELDAGTLAVAHDESEGDSEPEGDAGPLVLGVGDGDRAPLAEGCGEVVSSGDGVSDSVVEAVALCETLAEVHVDRDEDTEAVPDSESDGEPHALEEPLSVPEALRGGLGVPLPDALAQNVPRALKDAGGELDTVGEGSAESD